MSGHYNCNEYCFYCKRCHSYCVCCCFFRNGIIVNSIEQAHQTLYPLLGAASSGAFGLALIASGLLSSSAVGTMAGQTIMQGFVGLNISDNVTRLVTMLPGMLIIISGLNPMKALVLIQVTLSFILPVYNNSKRFNGFFSQQTTHNHNWLYNSKYYHCSKCNFTASYFDRQGLTEPFNHIKILYLEFLEVSF